MNQVVIMSGISGSGKSYLAEKMLQQSQGVKVSTDHYFMVNGRYQFDPSKLAQAHADCFRQFIDFLQASWKMIVVDNTNLSVEEIAPYYLGSQAFGYQPIIHIIAHYPSQRSLIMDRNVHGLAPATILKQVERMEQRVLPSRWNKLVFLATT